MDTDEERWISVFIRGTSVCIRVSQPFPGSAAITASRFYPVYSYPARAAAMASRSRPRWPITTSRVPRASPGFHGRS